MTCARCQKSLSYNELGLNKKYNGASNELCIDCLADKLGVTSARLREKIAEFLSVGCQLFVEEKIT